MLDFQNLIKCIIGCTLSVFCSCNNQDEVNVMPPNQGIIFSVDPFTNGHNSRTSVDKNNNYQIVWSPGDVVGVFPREGYQEPFTIPAEQIGQSQAIFDGGYWSLKDGLSYAAYYPFNKTYFESSEMKRNITVSYANQQQNGAECKVGSHDYTYSDWMTAEFGSINLKMHHLGAFVILRLPIPVTTNYHLLEISTTKPTIPIEGHYDLTALKPAIITDRTTTVLPIQLNNFTATANQLAEIYFMLPPMDLNQEELTFILNTDSGTCIYSIPGKIIKASTRYTITPKPTSCNIPGTTDEWLRKYGIIGGSDENVDAGGTAPDFGWGN